MKIKVAIYEDNDTLRESLSYLILGSDSLQLTGAFPDCTKIIGNTVAAKPDIILMDIDMPEINGIEATRIVKSHFPEINVMIITVFEDKDKVFNALRAGASGYLLKKTSSVQILEAVIELHNGGSPMTGEIARKVLDFFSKHSNTKKNEYELTSREMEILKCLVEGYSYKMISDRCFISSGTVYSHINNIYRKLHVNSKSEAVTKALREQIID